MLSIRGVYENGKIKLLERVPQMGRFEVIITFLEDRKKTSMRKDKLEGLLSDLQENDFQDFLEPYHTRDQDWFKGRGTEV